MDADKRGWISMLPRRFKFLSVLLAMTLIASGLALGMTISELTPRHQQLQRHVAELETRLDDVESLLSGRPYRFRTSGLAPSATGGVRPMRLAVTMPKQPRPYFYSSQAGETPPE